MITLLEVKKKILRIIEEINKSNGATDANIATDDDIAEKLNDVINGVLFEISRIKKIPVKEDFEVTENQEINLREELDSFYQLNCIKDVRHEQIDDTVTFLEDGTAKIFYYKYPKRISKDTNAEKYKFEITDDAVECLVVGAIADLLKNDVSNNYGQIYANRYAELKQGLDPRYARGSIVVDDDGIDDM